MADADRLLLSHYNLTTLYPNEWPRNKDDLDQDEGADSDDGTVTSTRSNKANRDKYKSRYATLERGSSLRTNVPGSQLRIDGKENLVQKDEADPLGTSSSVIQLLRRQGLHVEDDVRRNQFMLSSTTFSPDHFLSQVHANASTEDLLRGLDFLSQSIEKKSASLKVLVESNFERFVRAKATIDNVYKEMRNHGAEAEAAEKKSHSRQSSRTYSHWRSASGNSALNVPKSSVSEKRKNALIKESEFGVQGIKTPLLEANLKAEEVWGPALGGRDREESLVSVLASVDKNRAVFEAGLAIEEDIKKHDYESLAENYARAQKFASDAKSLADRAKQNNTSLSDAQIHQIIITSRVWMDVQSRLDDFKRHVWSQLTAEHSGSSTLTTGQKTEEHMELIAVLLQLGVDENPIVTWLRSRHDHLVNKISSSFERFRIELEISRRRLANGQKPSAATLASHLKSAGDNKQAVNARSADAPPVLRFWDKITTTLSSLLSLQQDGLLGEVMEFWETSISFLDGQNQKSLPIGIDGQSRKHHKFSPAEIQKLQAAPLEQFTLIYEQLNGLFVDPPVEDISQLYTPLPPTPQSPQSASLTPSSRMKFTFSPEDIPPSPKVGEAWEKYAFWPARCNSLSAAASLANLLAIVAVAASEIAAVDAVKKDSQLLTRLRNLVGDIRERSITAICAAWLNDSENVRELEDWTRSAERKEITNMPGYFSAFESSMLNNLQRIVYISDAAGTAGSGSVVLPPPQRHIETVQRTFRNSLYKAFSGMMEHAGKPIKTDGTANSGSLVLASQTSMTANAGASSIDVNSVNIRKLLTMSNFQTLRKEIVPSLVSQFEANFSTTINDDQKTAQDVLGQMNTGVFRSYVRPTVEKLEKIISAGILDPAYASSSARPTDANPYVYDVLLHLVLVHTEVSRTASSLTGPILSHLLEQVSTSLIENFKKRKQSYTLIALVQATLDVEFMAQTLNNYTTEKASEVQGKIYLALDERTDNDARMSLQKELPEMRTTLKRLRENTKGEFACFRKERRQKDRDKDRPKS